MRVSVGKVRVYVVPTQSDEADGTFEWSKTTVVTVEVGAGGKSGLGITFASKASAVFLDDTLRQVVDASDLFELPRTHERMREALRNAGRPGAGALALSAMDIALHDLTGHVLEQPLESFGGARARRCPSTEAAALRPSPLRHSRRNCPLGSTQASGG